MIEPVVDHWSLPASLGNSLEGERADGEPVAVEALHRTIPPSNPTGATA